MSLKLLFIMAALLLTNYVTGLLYGIWSEGFKKEKCIKGAEKYALILVGYGMLALIAFVLAQKTPDMEYISGLLLEPIARYFVKLIDRLKCLMTQEGTLKKGAATEETKEEATVVTLETVEKKA